jgi:HEPN domain-containing protein
MKPITIEWIAKAEGDWHSAVRESRARKYPNYDSACFHAQQCAEKYLKARLQEAGIVFGRTHHLIDLLNLALTVEPNWASLTVMLNNLSGYAVNVRYPGTFASKADARAAVAACEQVRATIRTALGLPV